MILCLPVVDGHDLTKVSVKSVLDTTTNCKVVIYDNASDKPYTDAWIKEQFGDEEHRVLVIRSKTNKGYYQPLIDLYDLFTDELIGLMHNDMVLYEQDWDQRMAGAFSSDPLLGLVGLCGSNELDSLGGRGGGTKCFFRGASIIVGEKQILAQSQDAGLRIYDLVPSVVLDSLFMMFRRKVITKLTRTANEWNEITLAHFYDRIWPCRVIEAGYRVGTMGVECDHLGGMTTTANERYRDDCIKFLDQRGIPFRTDGPDMVIAAESLDPRNIPSGNPETEMYLLAERRFLNEYREQKHFLPVIVDANWNYNGAGNYGPGGQQ